MPQTSILVGSMHGVGEIAADPSDLRGNGGPLAPSLEVNFDVRLNPRSEGDIALKQLSAELWLPLAGSNKLWTGASAVATWSGGFVSLAKATNRRTIVLRFPLSQETLRLFELHAQRTVPSPIPVEFRFEVTIAWVRWASNEIDRSDPKAPKHSFPPSFGVLTEVGTEFQTASVHELTLYLGREQWAEQILPALGLDRVRLVAVRLPKGGPLPAQVVLLFDEARRHYDEGRYKEAIKSCRDLRYAVEKSVGATSGTRVAAVVAARRKAPADGPLYKFVDGVWTSLVNLTDDASHPELKAFSRVDARACLLLTATMVEALTDILTDSTDLTTT